MNSKIDTGFLTVHEYPEEPDVYVPYFPITSSSDDLLAVDTLNRTFWNMFKQATLENKLHSNATGLDYKIFEGKYKPEDGEYFPLVFGVSAKKDAILGVYGGLDIKTAKDRKGETTYRNIICRIHPSTTRNKFKFT